MAPATTATASVPRRTTRNISAVRKGYPSIQEYSRRAFFFADHSLLELIFPSLDRTRGSSKCPLISSLSRGARPYRIPKSSEGPEGGELSVSPAGGGKTSTMSHLAAKKGVPCRGRNPPP